jgi:3'-phosphoadenosine 5'-phosphosulfate sulfotransferase (PAPS reductase)/FAD synthetase
MAYRRLCDISNIDNTLLSLLERQAAAKTFLINLLKIQENKVSYDEIVFADTGFEYPELYAYIEYLEKNYQLPGASLFQFLTFRASLAVILSLFIR